MKRTAGMVCTVALVGWMVVACAPPPPTARVAVQVSAGVDHGCALVTGGKVLCWGDNEFGQLGNGTTTNSSVPVRVSGIAGATQIASGGSIGHCALVADGAVKCWGWNEWGQLGNGTTTDSSVPVKVPGITGATQITKSHTTTCALLAGGVVACWGVPVGGGIPVLTPRILPGIAGMTEINIGGPLCMLDASGAAKCMGRNQFGELGDGTNTDSLTVPVDVVGIEGAVQLGRAGGSECALAAAGTVKCWGKNLYGTLGDGTYIHSNVPVEVVGVSDATAIGGGLTHMCAVLTNGETTCWGDNTFGQLGDGTTNDSNVPVGVTGITNAIGVTGGGGHTCALAGGGVKCWGVNSSGRLGDGTETSSTLPVAVVGIG